VINELYDYLYLSNNMESLFFQCLSMGMSITTESYLSLEYPFPILALSDLSYIDRMLKSFLSIPCEN
jgi:hypothetical protein